MEDPEILTLQVKPGLTIEVWQSKTDGAMVVQIDSEDDWETMRVYLNDSIGVAWESR